MKRKYTRKAKTQPKVEIQPEKPAAIEQLEDLSGLPDRDLLRVYEVAMYLSKAESTIRLWIDHGYFITEKFRGSLWVTKQSVIDFRLKNRVNNDEN